MQTVRPSLSASGRNTADADVSTASSDCRTSCSNPWSSQRCLETRSNCFLMSLWSSRERTTATSTSRGRDCRNEAGSAKERFTAPSMNCWRQASSCARAMVARTDARYTRSPGSRSIHVSGYVLKCSPNASLPTSGENLAPKMGATCSVNRSNQETKRTFLRSIDPILRAVRAFFSTRLLLKQHSFLDIPRAKTAEVRVLAFDSQLLKASAANWPNARSIQ